MVRKSSKEMWFPKENFFSKKNKHSQKNVMNLKEEISKAKKKIIDVLQQKIYEIVE